MVNIVNIEAKMIDQRWKELMARFQFDENIEV